ncbi:MAG: cytochrome c3 family protein [Planctomycetota bacterium]|jgi:hypothetical protein
MKWILATTTAILITTTATAQTQTYVGDQVCAGCHANNPVAGFFEGYRNSGHRWKLFRSAGETPDADNWPWTDVPPLPVVYDQQLEWSDVEYVIGNFFWKARFVDADGFIYTGDADETTQWNIATQEFVPYHAGEADKPYNCGRCHTTGYDPDGNQNGAPGLVGTWAFDGVQCEACHGPASGHVGDPFNMLPDSDNGKACSECHYRDDDFRMPWKGGFMRHHQQSEDLSHSSHAGMLSCESCHNPHRSVVYQDGGTIAQCSQCHPGSDENDFYQISGMGDIQCTDCHMPYMGKSAAAFNEFTGDIRGHLFQIMTDPIAAEDNVYADGSNLYWNQDANGDAFVTLDYACLGCHTDIGSDLTLAEAAEYAVNIHGSAPVCPEDTNGDGVVDVSDLTNVILGWGPGGGGTPADINGDGVVDVSDLTAVILAWGDCG